jgi:nicotinamide-nucleotide amidase
MGSFSAEILCVGDEILLGRTLDTNSNWLCNRVYELGGRTKRITVVGDDVDEISAAIRESVARAPAWLFVTGGLGPTRDDKTLMGLARAAGVRLRFSRAAARMIEQSVRRRNRTYTVTEGLDKARKKMATIPSSSKPIPNSTGTAPAVFMKFGLTSVVSMPGVPAEMKSIFESSISGMVSSREVPPTSVDVTVTGVPEASMADFLGHLTRSFPELYIKSHPQISAETSVVVVQVTGRGEAGMKDVMMALSRLKKWLDSRGASYKLTRREPHSR